MQKESRGFCLEWRSRCRDEGRLDLRRLKEKVGGRNKLAKLLGVTGPYIGRVLSGEKPMTEELGERLTRLRRSEEPIRSGP
jgi:hypothetical protein